MSRPTTLPAAINDTVARVLAEARARNALVIGTLPIAAVDANAALRTTRHVAWPPTQPLGTTTFDVAVVADALAAMPRPEAIALLAQLRDVLAHRVLVISTAVRGAHDLWSDADFRAYGFRCLQTHEEAGQRWQVYEFSIDTYKTTPDWLNARNWAHPELFDKFRW